MNACRYQALLAEASSVAQEALGSVRTVRSFAMEAKEATAKNRNSEFNLRIFYQ